MYRYDGEALCMDCIFSASSECGKCDICGECGVLIAVNGEMLCIECASEELEEYDGEL